MNEEHGQTSIVSGFSQLLMLPITAFITTAELLINALREIQRVSKQSIQVMLGSQDRPNMRPCDEAIVVPAMQPKATPGLHRNEAASEQTQITHEEETHLTTDGNNGTEMDKDLHDDMLKLVRFKLLFVRREYEVAFPEKEDLVSDNMDGSAFTAWKVAEFIQELQRGNTPVPSKWTSKGYPGNPDPPSPPFQKDGKLLGIPPEDKKYLRVYYEVLERYPREKFKYEEQQIRVLEEIRDKLP